MGVLVTLQRAVQDAGERAGLAAAGGADNGEVLGESSSAKRLAGTDGSWQSEPISTRGERGRPGWRLPLGRPGRHGRRRIGRLAPDFAPLFLPPMNGW